MNPLRAWIREKGVVHPRDPRHHANLGSNDSTEGTVLNLIEKEIEWIGAVTLIGVERIVAWQPEVTSRGQPRKYLDIELILHQRKEKIGTVLRDRGDNFI
jgi:hypothetical protein